MINNLEKVNVVIDKVIRDLGLGHNEIPYGDFIEWVGEALMDIGSYYQFVEKETMILKENHEGTLPCDLHKVKRLKRGTNICRDSSGGFWGGTLQGLLSDLGVNFEELNCSQRYTVVNSVDSYRKADNPYDAVTNRLQYNSNLVGNTKSNKVTNLDFNVNFDKITTSFESGVIELQYLAMPTDENGYPLVPDNQAFRNALFWKIAMQLCMRDPEIFRNKQLQNYDYVRSKWNFYCTQARAEANMPDIHGMERMKNMFLSLVPRYNEDLTDYKNLGKPQFIAFDK